MRKKLVVVMVFVLIFTLILNIKSYANDDIVLSTAQYNLIDSKDITILETEILKCQEHQAQAMVMANAARGLGYNENHPVIILAQNEALIMNTYITIYQNRIEQIKDKNMERRRLEYPEATEVWEYLKAFGWNDYVCAGIMGNLMAETGGNTLKLRPQLTYKSTFYGICQWHMGLFGTMSNKTIQEQCDFLKSTIKYEIDTFGRLYQEEFTYEDFLELNNSMDAALAFAKSYERCSSTSYEARQENAAIAYRYFVD